jgi:hypothetical protein
LAVLPASVPTERDIAALDPEFRLSEVEVPVAPLDLVSLAGQFAEPVSRMRERFEPYLGLLANESLPVTPDVVPVWQDLIVLSARLDGLLPSLEGEVTPEQIAFAADGVEESEQFVRERLGLYADMFGLELAAAAPAAPAVPDSDESGEAHE